MGIASNKRTRKQATVLAAAIGAGALIVHSARAADFTWDGGSTSTNNWSTGTNWLSAGAANNTVPASGSNIIFGTSSDAAVLDSSQTIGSMTFSLGSSYTLGVSNSSSLTINTGITTTGNNDTYTISPSVILGSSNSWNVGANTSLTLAAVISQSSSGLGISKSGSGTLNLNANNSYTGVTTIAGGVVNVTTLSLGGSASGLGSAGSLASNLIINGGTLRWLGTADNVTDRNISLGSSGGTIEASATTSTNNLTFGGGVTPSASSGSQAIVLTGTNTGGNSFTGVVANGGGTNVTSLTKGGVGKWSLSENNTYTGATTISGGTLEIANVAAGGSASPIGSAGSIASNLVLDGGALLYGGATGSTNRLFSVTANNGIIDASGSGSLLLSNSGAVGYSGTGDRRLTLTGSSTADNTLTPTIGNPSGGATELVKEGAGKWILAGNSSYTGVTTISSGILQIGTLAHGGSPSAIGSSGSQSTNLVLDGGTLRYIGGATSTNRLFTVTTNDGTIESSGSGSLNFTNTGAISRSGTATLTLSGTNTNDNTLAASLPNSGSGTTLVKSGAGKWVMSNSGNTYQGATIINGGTLETGSIDDSTGSGIGNAGNGLTLDGGALRYTGASTSTTRVPTLGASGGTIDASGSGSLNLSGTTATPTSGTGVRTLTLTGNNTANNTVAFNIANDASANATSLVKDGTGKWVLSKTTAHSFTGSTTINGGTLSLVAASGINNPIGNSTRITVGGSGTLDVTGVTTTGSFQLGSSQILSGTGVVYGNVTANNSASKVMPGDVGAPGTLTLKNNFTLATASPTNPALAIESDTNAFSLLTVEGSVTLGGALQLKANRQPALNTPITILNKTSAGAISGIFSGLAQSTIFHPTSGTYTSDWYQISYLGGNGNDVTIMRTSVPEPTSLSVLALGACGLLQRRRRASTR